MNSINHFVEFFIVYLSMDNFVVLRNLMNSLNTLDCTIYFSHPSYFIALAMNLFTH